MKKLRLLLLLIPMLACIQQVNASHIIGGEIKYECIGENQYLVTLILYRDCTSLTPFDNPAYMTVFTQDGEYVTNFTLSAPVLSDVPAESDNPCLDAPDDICVEQAIYTKTITLAASEVGYLLVYQRCCRNAGIVNLNAPEDSGATCTQEIPPNSAAECNNSPYFNDLPPTVICLDDPIVFDHSATDIDGDSLAYSFFWPYDGADPGAPAPTIASDPPYVGVVYAAGFDEFNPITAAPAFNVDPITGLLTGTAIAEGRYVVGVVCEEYRDGILLGNHIRDFQFNVVACTPAVVAQLSIEDVIFNDIDSTAVFLDCTDFLVEFDNFSTGGDSYFWDFGDGGTSTEVDPTHIYADTGMYYVTLIVNPGFTCADTALGAVGVYNTLTAAYDFSAGCSGTPVVFDDNSTSTEAGEINAWDWDFDDGSASTDENPEHEYADGGTYTVTLTVQTDKGCESSIAYDILVEPGPDVAFDVDDVCQNVEAEFDNNTTITTGSISSYAWDFGDGSTSAEDNPSHLYGAPGTYTVTLIAFSANGCSDTLMQDIYIGELPFADAGEDDTVAYLETFQLNGSGVGDFYWLAGNPIITPASISSVTVNNPTVELTETTTFTLTVTSPDGCSETDDVTIYVTQYTIVEVPNAFSPNGDGYNDEIFVLNHEVSELLEYTIYNRYGQIVFTTSDINGGWNGMVGNDEAEIGTYIYLVRAYDMDGVLIQRQGNITLVR
ncbi:MAG: PKD domain-containing protein [Bacteroidetes bacterium]|nr:PKD domain-containing protein [Bacteroidota bacterium]